MHATQDAAAIVTGAAGFIGSHLSIALLQRGCRVIGIDNFDPFYGRAAKVANIERIRAAGAFTLVEADIRDRERIAATFAQHRPSSMFHIAALAGVRPSIADPARYASVNIDGLVSVLDAARGSGCRTVAFASSSSVYGNNRKVPFAETDPVDEPISPYAATKRAGELLCHTYAHLFGLRIAALRFFTVFGPAQRPDLAIGSFMRRIAAGDDVPMFGDGTTSRDYTYIDDIVEGVLAAEQAVARGLAGKVHAPDAGFFRIWNLGGSHPHTLAEMINAIARVVGKPAKIKRMPMQPGDVERTFADLTRSHTELGFQPKTTFEEGLRRQWAWLKTSLSRNAAEPATIG
jgi:UDP-glucuronate 4-epimerase